MTYNCPLAREQKLPEGSRMEDKTDPKSRETGFVVDSVPSAVYGKLPGHSVIPPYNAVKDKYASAYFQSPTVRAIMERNQQLRVRSPGLCVCVCCLLYTSPSPRDMYKSRMPSSA